MTLDTAVLADLAAKHAAATPGPWRWYGQVGQYVDLTTVDRGILTVMGSKRLGMNGAEPLFFRREPDAPWGHNGRAEPASKVAVREVPYRNDIVDIDNPNAQLIVAAVNALPALLAEVESLRAVRDAAAALLEADAAPGPEGADLSTNEVERAWIAWDVRRSAAVRALRAALVSEEGSR